MGQHVAILKFFKKKIVIGCHRAHTFTWLNLLLEPKRLLQRFGFVFLGDASFCGVSHKEQEKQEEEVLAMFAFWVLATKNRRGRREVGREEIKGDWVGSAFGCKQFLKSLSSAVIGCIHSLG